MVCTLSDDAVDLISALFTEFMNDIDNSLKASDTECDVLSIAERALKGELGKHGRKEALNFSNTFANNEKIIFGEMLSAIKTEYPEICKDLHVINGADNTKHQGGIIMLGMLKYLAEELFSVFEMGLLNMSANGSELYSNLAFHDTEIFMKSLSKGSTLDDLEAAKDESTNWISTRYGELPLAHISDAIYDDEELLTFVMHYPQVIRRLYPRVPKKLSSWEVVCRSREDENFSEDDLREKIRMINALRIVLASGGLGKKQNGANVECVPSLIYFFLQAPLVDLYGKEAESQPQCNSETKKLLDDIRKAIHSTQKVIKISQIQISEHFDELAGASLFQILGAFVLLSEKAKRECVKVQIKFDLRQISCV